LLSAACAVLLSALSRACDWGMLKGSKLCLWDVTKQHLYSVDLNFNTESFPGIILTRSRDTYYITSCSCSWPLLLLLTTAATPRLHPRRAQRRRHSATTCRTKMMTGMEPHAIMAFVQHLLVVGCLCRFALSTPQGIRL
jgi:hypothetical protein